MATTVKKVIGRARIRTITEKRNLNYKETWSGNERLERILIRLSKEYLDASNSLKDQCGGEELIHNTIAAINGNIFKIKDNRVDVSIEVSQKLTKLVNFSAKLISKYKISPDLVLIHQGAH